MWGNALGWGISALIVVATVAGLVWVGRMLNSVSDPTAFSTQSGVADAIVCPTAPPDALPSSDGDADSVSLYHHAVDLYEQNRTLFNEFAQRPNRTDLPTVDPAVDLLRKAAGKSSLGIFSPTPAEAVSYDANTPLAALNAVGKCACNAALLSKASGKTQAATSDLEAAFCLGQRMADEHLCYAELSDGLGLMGGAAVEMAEMAKGTGDEHRADELNAFAASLSDFANHKLVPIQTVLSSIDQSVIEQNAGDLFWIARNSKARMWRVEAIHALGRLQYDAGRPGDNRGATRVLGEIEKTDPDPIIKTAATQAHDLTLEQFYLLH